jgi:hypothetical protein
MFKAGLVVVRTFHVSNIVILWGSHLYKIAKAIKENPSKSK